MIIAQISDTHISLESPDADRKLHDLVLVADSINALDPAPDLVVHTGDIVHNGLQEEYSTAVKILESVKAPVCALVGNKDDRQQMRDAFSPFGFLEPQGKFIDYVIDHYALKIIALDTLSPGHNKGEVCMERIDDLKRFLDKNKTKPAIVFAHHPPIEVMVGPEAVHFRNEDNMLRFQEVLNEYSDAIVAICCGHVHREAVGNVGTIPVNIMSAVATALRKGEYPKHMENRPTYQLHTYIENSGLVTETRIV